MSRPARIASARPSTPFASSARTTACAQRDTTQNIAGAVDAPAESNSIRRMASAWTSGGHDHTRHDLGEAARAAVAADVALDERHGVAQHQRVRLLLRD